jgi:predicted dehydrogenase
VKNKHHIGLVGCGRWGRLILRDLRSLNCEVTVVTRSEQSRKNAIEGGAANIVDAVSKLTAVEGVVIASLTVTHALVIEELLERNIPIFVEKPMTVDLESARRFAKLADDRLFVMDKWRYHPGIEMLSQIASSRELGLVLGLRTLRVNWGSPHSDVDGIWILAPHDLAIALEILGEIPSPRCAVAQRMNGIPTGLMGILGEKPWFVLEVSTSHRRWLREIWLYCENGFAVLNDAYSQHIEITYYSNSEQPILRPVSKELPLFRELKAFIGYLEGGPPPRSSAREGAVVVDTIMSLRRLAGLDLQG